jgi:hypothetical protein
MRLQPSALPLHQQLRLVMRVCSLHGVCGGVQGGSLLGLSPPYPLAIFSGGFTVNSAAYRSTAARLASWG